MPLNILARIYRTRIVGNPWLYHARWWIKDVVQENVVRVKIEAESLRECAVATARSAPFTLRVVRDLISNKIRNIRRDRQGLPHP